LLLNDDNAGKVERIQEVDAGATPKARSFALA
jgi:hypothetical protein